MKPFLSFCVILILFQTLLFGSLVKLDFPDTSQDQWGKPIIHKQIVLDPFVMPGKEGLEKNLQNKNEWMPFHFGNTFLFKNRCVIPKAYDILINNNISYNCSTIPLFILNSNIRI